MPVLTTDALQEAITYNTFASKEVFKEEGLPAAFVLKYHKGSCHAAFSPAFAEATASFQKDKNLKVDGKLGPKTLGAINAAFPAPAPSVTHATYQPPTHVGGPILLTEDEQTGLVQFTVKFEGGKGANPYAGMNKDAEWEGWFDRPKRDSKNKQVHPSERSKLPGYAPHNASKYHPGGGFHIGLSYGAWQAAQEPGSLGELLKFMHQRHPALFAEVFGPAYRELLSVTGAMGKRTGTRSVRTQPVGGADLWTEPWLGRFKDAAEREEFRLAQRQWVASRYLSKVLPTAETYNMDSRGALAVLFDISIQFGTGGMRKYVGRAKLVAGKPFDPDSIKKVIAALPKHHHARRNSILADAGQDVRYTW